MHMKERANIQQDMGNPLLLSYFNLMNIHCLPFSLFRFLADKCTNTFEFHTLHLIWIALTMNKHTVKVKTTL